MRNIGWLTEYMDDAVILVDAEGIVRFRSAEAARIYANYGYIYDIIGKEYEKVACHGGISLPIQGAVHTAEQQEISIRGTYYRIRQNIIEAEGCCFLLVVMRNITAERQSEQASQMRRAAVQEAHHQIKNSLNMIYSLLDMQRRRCEDARTEEALQVAMDRILSVAATYEVSALCVSDTVELFPMIVRLRDHFTHMAAEAGKALNITVQGFSVEVGTDVASTISLVVNELLQNAYKHAFPGRITGNIHIELRGNAARPAIAVWDDGIGFSLSPSDGKNGRIGLHIVEALVNGSLGGQLSVRTGPEGTEVSFGFQPRR